MRMAGYLALAIGLVVFGFLAMFSIGFPFLLTGLLMLALIRHRRRAEIMVPALLWPWVFTLGYVLVAPLGCTTSATSMVAAGVGGVEDGGATRCNALFFTYSGDASYSPPLWPALFLGAALATGVALLVRRAIRPRQMLGQWRTASGQRTTR